MHSVFNVTSILTDYTNKLITIETNFTVDPDTVTKKNIQVNAASSGTTVLYKLSTDDNKIIVTLKEWPDIDNTYYEVRVSGIQDMLKRDLVSAITKNVIFKPDTKLKVKIQSPKNNEAIVKEHNLINFSIIQINPDGTETTKPMESVPPNPEGFISNEAILEDESEVTYHFEFASDVAFFDIVKDYSSVYTEGYIQLDPGQYYMRARAIENTTLVGDWSETFTFTVVPELCLESDLELEQAKKDYIEDILAPVEFFLGEAEVATIVFQSKNGVTYPEFSIEFNKDIDSSKLPDTIMSFRRDL